MEDTRDTDVGVGPRTIAPYSGPQPSVERRSKRVVYTVEGGDKSVHRLLQDMRAASGLSLRALAERMGIQRGSLNQYFWQRRGGGSSRLSWFLRFAEACGCKVWLTFPSLSEQIELKSKYYRPPGNPNFLKKKSDDETDR